MRFVIQNTIPVNKTVSGTPVSSSQLSNIFNFLFNIFNQLFSRELTTETIYKLETVYFS